MPYLPLEEHLPGITGLLEYRRDTAEPIRALTQILLRGENTLTPGERELIATVVSNGNQCRFCTNAHTAVADLLLGNCEATAAVKSDIDTAPVSEKMKALLHIAAAVQRSGKEVTPSMVERAKMAGATDMELHDTVLIAALFSLYNRYVDGLSTVTPGDAKFYDGLAARISKGYERLPNGYDHLKRTH
ncbi:MAG: carboxymuconolactone decarboxylase family protein [Bacteroidetes bacterium]|nr:carboxymuconolactone decarboxylase family protein [Bacteroidota bacterium]MBS1977096.1 carboxymuconolactone decarboxylase family protein [Bacteroidota bacterium]